MVSVRMGISKKVHHSEQVYWGWGVAVYGEWANSGRAYDFHAECHIFTYPYIIFINYWEKINCHESTIFQRIMALTDHFKHHHAPPSFGKCIRSLLPRKCEISVVKNKSKTTFEDIPQGAALASNIWAWQAEEVDSVICQPSYQWLPTEVCVWFTWSKLATTWGFDSCGNWHPIGAAISLRHAAKLRRWWHSMIWVSDCSARIA